MEEALSKEQEEYYQRYKTGASVNELREELGLPIVDKPEFNTRYGFKVDE